MQIKLLSQGYEPKSESFNTTYLMRNMGIKI